jgi:hypothetical protein
MKSWIRKFLGIDTDLKTLTAYINSAAMELDRENQARKEETKFLNRKLDMLMMGAQPGKDE